MNTTNPKAKRDEHRRPLTRLWDWLRRRGWRPKRSLHAAEPNRHPLPPICYDME